jgi:hypothetical protein
MQASWAVMEQMYWKPLNYLIRAMKKPRPDGMWPFQVSLPAVYLNDTIWVNVLSVYCPKNNSILKLPAIPIIADRLHF